MLAFVRNVLRNLRQKIERIKHLEVAWNAFHESLYRQRVRNMLHLIEGVNFAYNTLTPVFARMWSVPQDSEVFPPETDITYVPVDNSVTGILFKS